jgi:hypothetical protein
MRTVLDKLRGGDLRSIGRANEVVADIKENPALFETVFRGLYDHDPVVRMRSADVIEKTTRERPELLFGYKDEIISIMTNVTQQEVCWHMAQIVPHLEYSNEEENEVIRVLKAYLSHRSKIVRVCAMEAIAKLAEKNKAIMELAKTLIVVQVEAGSPAIRARGKKLLKRLNKVGN